MLYQYSEMKEKVGPEPTSRTHKQYKREVDKLIDSIQLRQIHIL